MKTIYKTDAHEVKVAVSNIPALPVIVISDFAITSGASLKASVKGIYNVKYNEVLDILATVVDADNVIDGITQDIGLQELPITVMAERVKGGDINDVIDDDRFSAMLTSTTMSLNSPDGFQNTGNYVITEDRLNKGLKAINAPFRVSMNMLEFDATIN